MIGDTWKSELRSFKDETTGQEVIQLTTTGNNVHLYFTENSFDIQKNEIIFRSDRASGENRLPHDNPHYDVFKMDLDSGVVTQLSAETGELRQSGSMTKTPDSSVVVYGAGKQIKALDPATGKNWVIYEETQDYNMGAPSIACSGRYIGFCRNENRHVQDGPNYTGFKERFYRVKDGRITIANMDGSGWFDAFKDTHQVGHFQWCPDDPTIATYCHEGPWNLVTQRIWLFDLAAREAKPCFRQDEQDSIGHEFWTQDGFIFFDDRGPGHDGTITSDRTQAVAKDVHVNENTMIPFVGLCDRKGNLVRKIDMPFYCNHYHANPDNTVLVGDDVDQLVLVDISGEKASLKPLVTHGTSWHTQSSHCHPTWSWDGSRILWASDKGGKINLYMTFVK
jgi:oligogalacturonide lyase